MWLTCGWFGWFTGGPAGPRHYGLGKEMPRPPHLPYPSYPSHPSPSPEHHMLYHPPPTLPHPSPDMQYYDQMYARAPPLQSAGKCDRDNRLSMLYITPHLSLMISSTLPATQFCLFSQLSLQDRRFSSPWECLLSLCRQLCMFFFFFYKAGKLFKSMFINNFSSFGRLCCCCYVFFMNCTYLGDCTSN